MTIINARNEKGQVILKVNKQAMELIEAAAYLDAENKPGAWVKRHGKKFPDMDKFTTEDFNNYHHAKKMLKK